MGKLTGLGVSVFVILAAFSVAVLPAFALEGTWVSRAPLPILVKDVVAIGVNGQIYAMGYNYTYDNQTNTYSDRMYNYVYNTSADSWTSRTPMPFNQSQFALSVCQNKIYVIGGWYNYESSSLATNYITETIQVYDIASDSWQTKASMPYPRANFQATVVEDRIYLIGGRFPNGTDSNITQVYDPATDTWTELAPLPIPVSNYGSAAVEGKIYVIGGGNGGKGGNAINLVQIYDTKTNTWTQGTPLPVDAGNAVAIALKTAESWKIYAIGIPNQYFDLNSAAIMQIYDMQTGRWTVGDSVPAPGYVSFSAAAVNGTLYVVGGRPFAWFTPGLFPTVNKQYFPLTPKETTHLPSPDKPTPTLTTSSSPRLTPTPSALPSYPIPSSTASPSGSATEPATSASPQPTSSSLPSIVPSASPSLEPTEVRTDASEQWFEIIGVIAMVAVAITGIIVVRQRKGK